MKKIIALMVIMLLSLVSSVSAFYPGMAMQSGARQGAVYGELPYEGMFYARYPIYHTGYLGQSSYYGLSPYSSYGMGPYNVHGRYGSYGMGAYNSFSSLYGRGLGYHNPYGFGRYGAYGGYGGYSGGYRSYSGYGGYGTGHSYLSTRSFTGYPGFGFGPGNQGFYGLNYGAILHHYHQPILYPGTYRTWRMVQ